MPYNHTTFAQAKQRLANNLGDPGKVFFTDFELGRYLIEALQWWGLEAMYFRETGRITVDPTKVFYRVFDATNPTTGEPLQNLGFGYRSLVNDMALALMEPPITNWAGGWIGSEMFNLADLTASIEEALDEANKLTGYISTNGADLSLSLTGSRAVISDSSRFIKVLHASILESGGAAAFPMREVDQVQLQTTVKSSVFPNPGRPKMYSVSYTPQLAVDVWPSPQTSSQLLLRVVSRESVTLPDLTVADVSPFFIPDAALVLKYRALEAMFQKDGLSRAPEMAEYCGKRYKDGLDAISRYQSILWAEMAGKRKPLTSVAQLDDLRPDWASVGGPLRSIAQLNWSTFAVSPFPDTNYHITFEMVRKAIVPTQDSDFIQVGVETMRPIYDYAHHVALMKCQGAEFAASVPKYLSALEMARDYRDQVASQSYLYRETQLPPVQQRWAQPYKRKVAVEASQQDRQE